MIAGPTCGYVDNCCAVTHISGKGPIFIGGEGRSGTTLMRVILDSHPNIACGPESQLFIHPEVVRVFDDVFLNKHYLERVRAYADHPEEHVAKSFRQMMEYFFQNYMKKRGKKRWADKSPHNILRINFLLKIFPDLKFIHMVRDGRDVVSSILSMNWGPANVIEAAERWKQCIETGMKHRESDYYLEVKYEDLVTTPEKVLEKVFAFIGEDFDRRVLRFHETDHNLPENESSSKQVQDHFYSNSIGRFRRDLTEEQLNDFYRVAGETLKSLT